MDRDGVLNKPNIINGKPFAPTRFEDFILYDEIHRFIKDFKKNEYKIIVVTNQKDVGKGIISKNILNKMHNYLKNNIPIDEIRVCTCTNDCDCYKPNPGMLLEAKNKWKLDIKKCYIVGDSWRDIGAGHNAGCRTILIDRKYKMPMIYKPDFIVNSLEEAHKVIFNRNGETNEQY